MAKSRRRQADDYDDDYEDDFDDEYDDEYDDSPRRSSRSRSSRSRSSSRRRAGGRTSSSRAASRRSGSASRKKSSKSKSKQSGTPPWVLPVGIGVAALLMIGLGIGVAVALSGGDSDDKTASNDSTNTANAGANNTANNAPNGDPGNQQVTGQNNPNNFAPGPNANAGNMGNQPVNNGPARFWVELSNLSVRSSPPFNKDVSVSYRVVSGRPKAGVRYKIFFEADGIGMTVSRAELEVGNFASPNGTASITLNSVGMAGSRFKAYAVELGGRDGTKVSGEITPGGGPSSSSPPATAGQLAGGAAAGKSIALANARRESSQFGQRAYVVDYEVIGQLDPGKRYHLIVRQSGGGNAIKVDFSSEFRRNKTGTLRATALGVAPSGSVEYYIATDVGFRVGNENIVSNTVSQ